MWQNSKKKRQFFKMETIKTLAEPWALHLIQWCTKKLLGEMKTHIFAPQAAKHRLVPDTCLKAKAPVKAWTLCLQLPQSQENHMEQLTNLIPDQWSRTHSPLVFQATWKIIPVMLKEKPRLVNLLILQYLKAFLGKKAGFTPLENIFISHLDLAVSSQPNAHKIKLVLFAGCYEIMLIS